MGTWVKRSGVFTVLRDVVFLGVGSFVIVSQTIGPPERVNILIIGAGLAILGVPGGIGLLSLARGNSTDEDTPPSGSSSRPRVSSRR